MSKTVTECLSSIGVTDPKFLDGTGSLDEEFSRIKKAYFKKVLVSHPDKGGSADDFRDVQTAFELLRTMFEKKKVASFQTAGDSSTGAFKDVKKDFERSEMPSWDYYYSAAEESVPTYRVEPAKSGRSACVQKGKAKKCDDPIIEKGEIRIGSMDSQSGTYTRWVHLECWRVPSKVWLGLPDLDTCSDPNKFRDALLRMNEVLFCGFEELSESDQNLIVFYVMNKENWAKLIKRKSSTENTESSNSSNSSTSNDVPGVNVSTINSAQQQAKSSPAKQEVVVRSSANHFVVPVPGRNGAISNALAGKTVVLTGLFPELGGGAGLNLGKDKAKRMIESFGGRVTGSVSGKTDILLVGKEPGFSKVSKARKLKQCNLMELKDLVSDAIHGGSLMALTENGEGTSSTALTTVKKSLVIKEFSRGYSGNSLAYDASEEELAIASGEVVNEELQTYRAPKKPKAAKATKSEDNSSVLKSQAISKEMAARKAAAQAKKKAAELKKKAAELKKKAADLKKKAVAVKKLAAAEKKKAVKEKKRAAAEKKEAAAIKKKAATIKKEAKGIKKEPKQEVVVVVVQQEKAAVVKETKKAVGERATKSTKAPKRAAVAVSQDVAETKSAPASTSTGNKRARTYKLEAVQ